MPKIKEEITVNGYTTRCEVSGGRGGFLEMSDGRILFSVEDGKDFTFSFTGTNFAVVPSIRGINPLTGLKASAEVWTSGRGDLCPADFSHGRLGIKGYCPKCEYIWSPSNYLYAFRFVKLSGWRVEKDTFRPFVMTNDKLQDVPCAVEGGAHAVDSIGFLFYRSNKNLVNEAWFGIGQPYWYQPILPILPYHTTHHTIAGYPLGTTSVLNSDGTYHYQEGSKYSGSDNPRADEKSVPYVGASSYLADYTEDNYFQVLPRDLDEHPAGELSIVPVPWSRLIQEEDRMLRNGPLGSIPVMK